MKTLITKRNVVPKNQYVIRQDGTRVKNLDQLIASYDKLDAFQLSPFEPSGDFVLSVLNSDPAWTTDEDELGDDYAKWLDDTDSAQFELPEDYRF